MRQVHRKALATVVLTGGALAMAGYAHADSTADGGAARSPGLLAGNTVQVPVNAPVNVCGNTVNVVGALNPAAGNSCANTPGKPPVRPRPATPPKPAAPHTSAPVPQTPGPPVGLADTGAGPGIALAAPAGAALLLGGIVLYRRARSADTA